MVLGVDGSGGSDGLNRKMFYGRGENFPAQVVCDRKRILILKLKFFIVPMDFDVTIY